MTSVWRIGRKPALMHFIEALPVPPGKERIHQAYVRWLELRLFADMSPWDGRVKSLKPGWVAAERCTDCAPARTPKAALRHVRSVHHVALRERVEIKTLRAYIGRWYKRHEALAALDGISFKDESRWPVSWRVAR